MKLILFITVIVTLWVCSIADAKTQDYKSLLIILTPTNVSFENQLRSEVDSISIKMRKQVREKDLTSEWKELLSDSLENRRIIGKNILEFMHEMDFTKYASWVSQSFLQHYFYMQYDDILAYATTDTSDGTEQSLLRIAESHSVRYVVNFSSIHIYLENNSKRSEIHYQLFDSQENEFVFDTTLFNGSKDPRGVFSCVEGSVVCTINNALSEMLPITMDIIWVRSESFQKNLELANERAKILIDEYLLKEPDPELSEIIGIADTSISTEGYFQGFKDESGEKFIAFFVRPKPYKTEDSAKLNSASLSIAHIVIGVKYNGRWFVNKDSDITFEADSKQDSEELLFDLLSAYFLGVGETTPATSLWETEWFARINVK